MSSDRRCRAEKALDEIFKQLNEDDIHKQIDEPIDATLQDFTGRLEESSDNRAPSEVFSQFVRCVYASGLKASWHVVNAEATSLALLEDRYQGLWSDGYCAAVLDATNSNMGGMGFVLAQLAEIIKTMERQEHVQAVFACQIDPSDWHLRCEIVKVLLDRHGPLLSPILQDCPPSQLADEIPALTLAIISSHNTMNKITT
jgi:hypothetical protein